MRKLVAAGLFLFLSVNLNAQILESGLDFVFAEQTKFRSGFNSGIGFVLTDYSEIFINTGYIHDFDPEPSSYVFVPEGPAFKDDDYHSVPVFMEFRFTVLNNAVFVKYGMGFHLVNFLRTHYLFGSEIGRNRETEIIKGMRLGCGFIIPVVQKLKMITGVDYDIIDNAPDHWRIQISFDIDTGGSKDNTK